MPVASVTRLRLRSWRFFFGFARLAAASMRSAQATPGNRYATARKTRGLAFWTLTLWDDERAMWAFVQSVPHRRAIAKLPHWCDEAATARWVCEEFPTWEQAVEQLRTGGRLYAVDHPSPAQAAGRIEVE